MLALRNTRKRWDNVQFISGRQQRNDAGALKWQPNGSASGLAWATNSLETLSTRGLWSQLAPQLLIVWLWANYFTSLIPHFLLYNTMLITILMVSVESHYISVCSHENEWMFYPPVVNCLVAVREVCHICGVENQWEVSKVHQTSLGAEKLEVNPNLLIPWAGDRAARLFLGRWDRIQDWWGNSGGLHIIIWRFSASTITTISTLRG